MRSMDEPEPDFPAGARLPPSLEVVRWANIRLQNTGAKGDREGVQIEGVRVDGDPAFA